MVSEKTGCSSGFRVNQYKSLCAFSLSLNSLNSDLIFVNWYKQPIVFAKQPIVFAKQPIVFAKQPIVFAKQPIVFLVLCFLPCVLKN